MSEYLDFAKKTAKKAGEIGVKIFREGFSTSYKSDETGHLSPVTEADKKSEKFILSRIRKEFPNHGLISEESGEFNAKQEYVWLVDPIDGTRNFSHKIPHFSVSIALLHKGNALCAAVYDPNMGELFFAKKGNGAFLNGKTISVSDTKSMECAVVSLDGATTPDTRKAIPKAISKIMPKVEALRIFGGAALGLCYVAAGRLDGTVNLKCHPHDVAAGGLILREAGGVIEDATGKESFPFMTKYVAGNPFVQGKLSEILNPLKNR